MNLFKTILIVVSVAVPAIGCSEKVTTEPVPTAPILKYIKMPSEVDAMPGTDVKISGVGFDLEDVLVCTSKSGQENFTPEIVSVTNYAITIAVPQTACGNYEVSVTRNGLTTVLAEQLYIPYVIILEDIEIPFAPVRQGEKMTIRAKGLEAGDKIVFESASYPANATVTISDTNSGGTEFTVPSTMYGVNTVKVTRDLPGGVQKMGTLGQVSVSVDLFAKIAGGIVFYTSDNGVHGLVVPEHRIIIDGGETFNFGAAVPNNFAGTKDGVYQGKVNTEILVDQYNNTKDSYAYGHVTPAVACDQLEITVDGIKYDDYFLPSAAELIELHKAMAGVQAAGYTLPTDNYWSSLEWDYSGGWVWAMTYVNFWERTPETIVTGCADRGGWVISAVPVRQF